MSIKKEDGYKTAPVMRKFRLEDYEEVIGLAIADGGCFRMYPRGTSMLPLLRQELDSVVLAEKNGRAEKYDIVLYKRSNGSYVLHRIMEVHDSDYVLCGDNQCVKEYGIRDEQLIGVVEGFYRGEKYISPGNFGYRIYITVWCRLYPLRKVLLKLQRLFRTGNNQ